MPSTRAAPRFARYAESDLPTEYGEFHVVVYRELDDETEHVAVVYGEVNGGEAVAVRVHSECLTGEVLHSLKCDCREQLDLALRRIVEEGAGAVLYLRQEGRGIGLGNKIRAYRKQQEGYDTVDANRVLGFEDDLRTYEMAAFMLRDLGIRSVRLMTNNPRKVEGLKALGVDVRERVPHHVEPHGHNEDYLAAKMARMGHYPDRDHAPTEAFPDDGVELGDASAHDAE